MGERGWWADIVLQLLAYIIQEMYWSYYSNVMYVYNRRKVLLINRKSGA